jgi:arylsulfatase A-like enzyme
MSPITRTPLALIALVSLVVGTGVDTTECRAAEQPNVILFVVDDMGWMDSGVYGSRYYETPNIDRLAARGMRFTDAYSANPLCSPTRASILTGKYPARLAFTTASGHQPPRPEGTSLYPPNVRPDEKWILPASGTFLPLEEVTVAEAFKAAGYRTGHFGKWHLGLEPPHWPDQQGFDVKFHGAPDPGPPSYHSPYGFKAGNVTDGPEGEYITDRLTDEAIKFIEASRDQPFLVHMWQYGVHGPWGHKKEITRTFVDKKDPRGLQANPIMASMLKSVDESLGRVVAKLDELGLADKTILIFSSDNGGNVHSNLPDDKRSNVRPGHPQYEKVQDYHQWADHLPPTNNTPLKKGKSWLYEGGVRVPLVVVWPGVVRPETTCDTPVMSIDFYPTMLEMAGVPRPETQKHDGLSLVPLLRQNGQLDREFLFNYFPHGGPTKPGGVTVRNGQWKLIRWFHTSPEFPSEHELYNLRDDLGETTNLAKERPEVLRGLSAELDRFLSEVAIAPPRPNPDYNPRGARLENWVPKACRTEVTDAGLRIQPENPRAFLAITNLTRLGPSGPLTLQLNVRCETDGRFACQWRTADQESFPTEGQLVQVSFSGSAEWQRVSIDLPVAGNLQHIRIYFPEGAKTVELEHAALRTQSPPRSIHTWQFKSL